MRLQESKPLNVLLRENTGTQTPGAPIIALSVEISFLDQMQNLQVLVAGPSFFEPVRKNSVLYRNDNSHNMHRTEVVCARCDSHLGHIFDDGPPPPHKRFCMNSISLDFEPDTVSK